MKLGKWTIVQPPILLVKTDEDLKKLKTLQNAYFEVFNNPAGQMVYEDLIRESAVDRTAFNARDGNQTNFNLGKQFIGFHLKKMLFSDIKPLQQQNNGENNGK